VEEDMIGRRIKRTKEEEEEENEEA